MSATTAQRVLIIGGAGLIGASLAERLLAEGNDVLVTDSLRALQACSASTRTLAEARLDALQARVPVRHVDVRDEQAMQFVAAYRPDVVVWLAALLASESRADPAEAMAVQVTAFDQFLSAGAASASRVVLASSSYVYGHFVGDSADEMHRRAPVDVYGFTKYLAEDLLAAHAARLGIESVIVRPSAVFGAGDPRPRFVSLAIESAAEGHPVVVRDGDFISDFTYVDDAAAGFALAAVHPAPPAIMNIAHGTASTNAGMAQAIGDTFQVPVIEEASTWRTLGYVPVRGALDITRAREAGFVPAHDVRAGIRAFADQRHELLAARGSADRASSLERL